MKGFWFGIGLAVALFFALQAKPAKAQTKILPANAQQEPISLRLETPVRIRAGQEAVIRIILRNPYRDEQVTLTAYASYMVGEAEVTTSASTSLTIDRSLVTKVDVGLATLSLVAGSPTFDGVAITGIRNNSNTWTFDGLTLPADGNDHILEIKAIR